MEFYFDRENKEDIANTIAFVLYKDGRFGVSNAGKPFNTRQLSQIAGLTIKKNLTAKFNNIGENVYVKQRDAALAMIRVFVDALDVDLVAICWRKADNELPKHPDDILFTLKDKERSDMVYFGYYDAGENMFIDVNVDGRYTVLDVAYWMPKPEAPMID